MEVCGEPPKKAMTRQFLGDWGGYFVRCECCATLGVLDEEPELDYIRGKYATEQEAVAAWNQRFVSPSPLLPVSKS